MNWELPSHLFWLSSLEFAIAILSGKLKWQKKYIIKVWKIHFMNKDKKKLLGIVYVCVWVFKRFSTVTASDCMECLICWMEFFSIFFSQKQKIMKTMVDAVYDAIIELNEKKAMNELEWVCKCVNICDRCENVCNSVSNLMLFAAFFLFLLFPFHEITSFYIDPNCVQCTFHLIRIDNNNLCCTTT